MILLFLFIVRINPNPVPDPPRYPYGSLMLVEIAGAPGAIDHIFALLSSRDGDFKQVLYAQSQGDPAIGEDLDAGEHESPLGRFNVWRKTGARDKLTAVIPCPRGDSGWSMDLVMRAFGGADTVEPSTLDIKITYHGVEEAALVSDSGRGPELSYRITTQPEGHWTKQWNIDEGEHCDDS
ncbi:MAG: hypothetical protein M5U09_01470 [Gammaproteobacteria bacterium]|nr:hypothetical protein [Gammaproteobacteria bacterium]